MKNKRKNVESTLAVALIFLVVAAIITVYFFTRNADNDVESQAETTSTQADNVTGTEDETTSMQADNDVTVTDAETTSVRTVLADDSDFQIVYRGLEDQNLGMNTFNLFLEIQNKTEKLVTVFVEDAYVNDKKVTVGAGMPLDIKGGKSAIGAFIVFGDTAEISSIEQFEKLEFTIDIVDESFDSIYEKEVCLYPLG